MGIAVIVATFNGARYIDAQLRSVVEQSLPPSLVVVADDGSTDNTLDIVRAIAAKTTVEVRIDDHPNLGLNASLERALRSIDADFVALADQDDIWHPDKLVELEPVLGTLRSVGAVFTNAIIIDALGRPTGRQLWSAAGMRRHDKARARRRQNLPLLVRWNCVTGATMVCTRGLVDLALPLPEDVRHDAWMGLLCACAGDLVGVGRCLMDYRLHGANTAGLPPLDPRRAYRQRRSSDPRGYEDRLFSQVIRRLEERGYRTPGAIELLRERLAFNQGRQQLSEQRLRSRVAWCVTALPRYRKFSKRMTRSVIYDLLLVGRAHE